MKIKLNVRRAALFFSIFFLLFSIAFGQTRAQRIENPAQSIGENSAATYADLIKLLVREDAAGERETVALDQLLGDERGKIYRGKFAVESIEKVVIENGGRKNIVLLVKLSGEIFDWQEMNVLALFETANAPRLLDAVDVQADRFTNFSETQPVLNISSRDDALLLVNSHSNAGESYRILLLVGVIDNRFKQILDDINLRSENNCAANYEEKAFLIVEKPSAKIAHSDISLDFQRVARPVGVECEQQICPWSNTRRIRLVWEGKQQKYVESKRRKINLKKTTRIKTKRISTRKALNPFR